jgi:hypothetical protein
MNWFYNFFISYPTIFSVVGIIFGN